MIKRPYFALAVCLFALSSAASAQSAKTFNNKTPLPISFTLLIREGNDPSFQSGTMSFDLAPNASQTVTYGTPTNIYLNGYSLTSIGVYDVFTQQAIVTKRSSGLDNNLNTNSIFDIGYIKGSIIVDGHN